MRKGFIKFHPASFSLKCFSIRLEKEKKHEGKQERFWLAGFSLFIYYLLLIFVPVQKDHVCTGKRTMVMYRGLCMPGTSWPEQLSVGSLRLVYGLLVVYSRLRRSPVFSLD